MPRRALPSRCWRTFVPLLVLVSLTASACAAIDAEPGSQAVGSATRPDAAGTPGSMGASKTPGTASAGSPSSGVPSTTTDYHATTSAPSTDLLAPATSCPTGTDPRPPTAQPAALGADDPTSTSSTPATPATPEAPATPSTVTSTTAAPPPTFPDAASAVAAFRRDPRIAGDTVSVSVWIDGLGEVGTANPDTQVVPASNEKLITAIGALGLLPLDDRLHTDLLVTGPVDGGVLHGDLVLVGGGDPSLTRAGPHSLDTLAQAVADAGITRVEGRLLVDDTRYDDQRSGTGWPSAWWASVGALSALVADRNAYVKTTEFLADPALTHGEVLRYGLTTRGIAVAGGVAHGSVDGGQRIARLDSPTVNELVTLMLLRSDNLIAELLVKEIGHRALHGPGTTAAGLQAIDRVIRELCVPNVGVSVDGSGLSRDDHRSARELRAIIQAAAATTWGMNLLVDLPLVGQPSALGGRLLGPRTTGNVRAKGGSLSNTRSLSAFLTTVRGRHAVLTIIVNGGAVVDADGAIDDLVTAIASLPA